MDNTTYRNRESSRVDAVLQSIMLKDEPCSYPSRLLIRTFATISLRAYSLQRCMHLRDLLCMNSALHDTVRTKQLERYGESEQEARAY